MMQKVHLIVNIKWYQYVRDSRGDRMYKLQSGCARGVTHSVGSIMRNVSGVSFDRCEKDKYILSRATVNKIIDLLN